MLKNNVDYGKYITNFIFAYLGIAILGMLFVFPFLSQCPELGYCRETAIWSVGGFLALWAVLIAVFTVACTIKGKAVYVIAVAAVVLVIYTVANKYAIAYGCAMFYNSIAENISAMYDIELWFADCTRIIYMQANVASAVNVFFILFAMLFARCICSGKALWMPMIIIFAAYVLDWFSVEKMEPHMIALPLGYLCLLGTLMILGRKKFNFSEKKSRLAVSFIAGVVCMVCLLSAIIRPMEDFNRFSGYDNAKSWLTDKFGKYDEMSFGGKVGDKQSIEFKDETVFRVEMPKIYDKTYIAGFVSNDYRNNQWKNEYEYSNGIYSFLDKLDTSHMLISDDFAIKLPKGSELNLNYSYSKPGTNRVYLFDSLLYISQAYAEKRHSIDYFDSYDEEYNKALEECLEVSVDDIGKLDSIIDSMGLAYYNPDYDYSAYEIVSKLQSYFMDNYTYTLSPGKVPVNRNAVDYFLFDSREGYCTYFASAGAMILRRCGIPARYVEGYAFAPAELNGEAIGERSCERDYTLNDIRKDVDFNFYSLEVKDKCAHAWVQIYLKGVGWVNVDFTPPAYSHTNEPTESETESTTEEETTTKEETTTEAGTTAAATSAANETSAVEIPSEEHGADNSGKWLVFVGIIGGFMVIFAIIIIVRHKMMTNRKKKAYNNHGGDVNSNIWWIYRHYLDIFRIVGIKPPLNDTFMQFARKVAGEYFFLSKEDAVSMAELMEKTQYSEPKADVRDLNKAKEIVEGMIKEIYGNDNLVMKIIHKYFYNL